MATENEHEEAQQAIARELHESGYTESEVQRIVETIASDYNGLPFGWIDLVDVLIERGYTREEALKIVYLAFKAIRHHFG